MRLKKIFQILPMKLLLNLSYKVASLPIIAILNIALLVGIVMVANKAMDLNTALANKKNLIATMKNVKTHHVSDLKYREEFHHIVGDKDITIDQSIAEYDMVGPQKNIILAKYTMSLKGGYNNFLHYLHHLDELKLIERINSLEMKNESNDIIIKLNLDVLYDKNSDKK